MPLSRFLLVLSILATLNLSAVRAQHTVPEDRITPADPPTPRTKQDIDRQEAIHFYAQGLLLEREGRLLDAVGAFERVAVLDPESTACHKALVPLYHALERPEDALRACRRVLELQPGDYETWYVHARQLKMLDRGKEALDALGRAAACLQLKDNLELSLQVYSELGALYEEGQKFDKAVTALVELTGILEKPEAFAERGIFDKNDIDSQAAEAYERLGRVALRAGHQDMALTAFQKAQVRDPNRKDRVAYHLAQVHLARKNLPDALTSLQQYLLTQPHGTEGYQQWMATLRQLGRGDSVLPGLEKYSERDPNNVPLKLLLAQEYANVAQLPKAEAIYQTLVQQSPSSDVYRGLFALYRRQQGVNGAKKVLQQLNDGLAAAIKKEGEPANPGATARARAMLQVLREDPALVKDLLKATAIQLRAGAELKPATRYFLAVLAARGRQLDEAEKLFRSCLDAGDRERGSESDVYSGLLKVLWLGRKYDAVVEVCKKGLDNAQSTNRILFHHDMAKALMLLGKADQAIAEANAAVDLSDESSRFQCRRMRAFVLADAGQTDKAIAECEAMLKASTQPADIREARYALSTIYSTARKIQKAEEELQSILKTDPNDATACNDLGYIWADQGKNLPEAEKLIRKAIELDRTERITGSEVRPDGDQDNAAYVDSLGWVLFRRGRHDDARKELEKAAGMTGGNDDPVVWDHLGDVYRRLGDAARCRTAWTKSLELYEAGHRRVQDDRLKEIKKKLKVLEAQTQHR